MVLRVKDEEEWTMRAVAAREKNNALFYGRMASELKQNQQPNALLASRDKAEIQQPDLAAARDVEAERSAREAGAGVVPVVHHGPFAVLEDPMHDRVFRNLNPHSNQSFRVERMTYFVGSGLLAIGHLNAVEEVFAKLV